MTYSNGDAYDGDYANGNPTGQGKMLFAESKIIMNRNLRDGVDRASTAELKSNTFSLEKKKKNDLILLQRQNRPTAGGANPNANIMSSILGNLGATGGKGGKGAKPVAKRARNENAMIEHAEGGLSRSRKARTSVGEASKSAETGVRRAIKKHATAAKLKKPAPSRGSKTSSAKAKTVAKVKKLNRNKTSVATKRTAKSAAKVNPRIVVKIRKTRKPRASN